MFSFFKKKKKVYPDFPTLEAYAGKDSYFVRIASWGLLDMKSIYITDSRSGKSFSLEPWPQMVFIAAEGMLTVREYIEKVADKYADAVPAGLDKAIIKELNVLVEYGVVKLVNKKEAPAKQFNDPVNGAKPRSR